MIWINIHTSVLDSPEFLGCEPVDRATWLCLLRYCVGQENGGRITGCRQWKDRQWQQMVRITADEASSTCALWTWEGDDLAVKHYPAEKENEVLAKRNIAKKNGKMGGRPKSHNQEETNKKPTLVILEKPNDNPDETQVESGRGKEGERKDKEKGKELRAVALRILAFLNQESGKSFRDCDSNIKLITARLSERGVDEDGMMSMISRKAKEWRGDPVMDQYLRPVTIFGKEKFDGYYSGQSGEQMALIPEFEMEEVGTSADILGDDFKALGERLRQQQAGGGE